MSTTMQKKFSLKIKEHIDSPERKKAYNQEHFNEAARHYDFATKAMSLGRDTAWKRHLVRALPVHKSPVCIDLACGTGDVTFMVAEKYPDGQVIGVDLTPAMLDLAERRNAFGHVQFLQGDMGALVVPDASVDIITGSYAVRNAPDLKQAFTEMHRILKPGGVVGLLDFSKPASRWFQSVQYAVLKYWCGFWGLMLHGNPEVHSYISASLRSYPDRDSLHRLAVESGFAVRQSKRFYLGTLEMLILEKN